MKDRALCIEEGCDRIAGKNRKKCWSHRTGQVRECSEEGCSRVAGHQRRKCWKHRAQGEHRLCATVGCDNKAQNTRTLCGTCRHYRQEGKEPVTTKKKMRARCAESGCQRWTYHGTGYCRPHYNRNQRIEYLTQHGIFGDHECKTCGKFQSVYDFPLNKSNRQKLGSKCYDCITSQQKRERKNETDEILGGYQKGMALLRKPMGALA